METPKYVSIGETVSIRVNYSEVCMHMRVSGRVMRARIVSERMAQLIDDDGRDFSAPILLSEAGFFQDNQGIYCYPAESWKCPLCGQRIDDGKPCGCGARY